MRDELVASVKENFLKFSKDKKEPYSQWLFTASGAGFSTINWMTSSCSNADIEGSLLIFPVTQQGNSTNNTDIAGAVTNSSSISGGTPRHLKAAFP